MATWNKDNVVIPVVSTLLPSAVKIVREDLSYPGDAVSCTQTTKSVSRWIPNSNLDTEYEYVVYADDIEIGRIRGSDATEIFRHDVAIYGDLTVSGTINGDSVGLPYIGSATYTDLHDWWNTTQSAGKLTGGTITDNGNGSATVAAGSGIIKTTNNDIGESKFFNWAENTNVSLTDNSINYIYVEYNSGNPQIAVATSNPTDKNTNVLLGMVYREGTDLHITTAGQYVANYAKNDFWKDIDVNGKLQWSSGIKPSESGTRYLALTEGKIYAGLTPVTFNAFNSSATAMTGYYSDGGSGWTSTSVNQIDNQYYDDGSGALASLTNNNYTCRYIYIDSDNHVYMVYGTSEYNKLGDAIEEEPPDSVPIMLSSIGMLVSKVIIKQGQTNFERVYSYFGIDRPAGTVINHDELGNILGSGAYHLSESEHTELTEWMDDVTLSDGGEADLSNNYITSLQNTTDAGAGIVGNYYSFDGVDDYGTVSNCADIADDVSRTISFWFKAPSGQSIENPRLFEKKQEYFCYTYDYGNSSDVTVFGIYDDSPHSIEISNSRIFTNNWIKIDFIIDRENNYMYVYINGVLEGSLDISSINDIESSYNLFIGAKEGISYYINAEYAKFQIFNTALTADEVKALYSGASVPFKHQGASQAAFTSGTLTIGYEYIIDTYVSGDDFTNVGASSNASGEVFTATGTTPTDWSNGSSLRHTGCVLNLNKSKTTDTWYDESSNNLDATMHGATLVSNNKYGYFERGLMTDGDIKQEVHTSNVSNPPTDAELDALFTSPSSKGAGWTAYVKDSDTDSMYQITSDGTNWQIVAMTPADATANSSSTATSNIAFTENNEFPANMVLIRNEELNNTLSTSTGTPITVSSIDTGANTITLSWLPYIPSIWNPGSGRKWALKNVTHSGNGLLIDSGTYSTRVLNYTTVWGDDANWSVGDKVVLYNPYRSNIEFYDGNPVFLQDSGGIYTLYANPGGGFYHSDGSYILLVNASTAHSEGTVGAYKSDGSNWFSWSQINGGATIFDKSEVASDWREDKIVNANVIKLPTEDRYIGYFSGYSSTDAKWRISYVKFDEDFSSGSMEYADSEIIDSSSSSNGLELGSVIYYGGKWRMIYVDRADGTLTNWSIKEAFSDTPEGPFTASGTTIVSGGSTNDGVFYSSHPDGAYYFIWKGRLYTWIAGTASGAYYTSGTSDNRVFGLWYFDELSGTDAWVEIKYNPVFINPMEGQYFWPGVDNWMDDHFGRNISMALNNYDGKLYIFFNGGYTTDTYQGGIATMDLPSLLEHY